MRRRWNPTLRLSVAYTGWMAAIGGCYFAFPGWHLVTWALIGLTCVAGIATGVVLHRPSHVLPWLLLAAANLAYTAGDTSYNVLTSIGGLTNPYPSVADAFYLATYPLYALGLFGFIRRRTGRDPGALLDALIVTVGLALLSWRYLIEPRILAGEDGLSQAVSIAYPLGDVLMLAMLARLVFGARGLANPALRLLAAGTVGILFSDVIYGLLQLHGHWTLGTPVDLGWLVFYWAWGLAALQPSMRGLTQPVPMTQRYMPTYRLALIGGGSLIAPAVLLVESVQGRVVDGVVISVFSVVLFVLVVTRLAREVAAHRAALVRARVLRTAGAMLVSALDIEQVAEATRQAAGMLFVPAVPYRVVLAVRDGDEFVEAAPTRNPPWRLSADGGGSAALRRILLSRRVELVPTAQLGDDRSGGGLVAELGGLDTALVCPLDTHRAPDEPLVGMLVVAADDPALDPLGAPLAILASQAALAVARLSLAREVDRRNSEAYFRSLVHTAFDVILILEDDDTIRYASPSAATMFGDRPLEGHDVAGLAVPGFRSRLTAALAEIRGADGVGGHEEWHLQHADGTEMSVEMRCADLRADPTVGALVLTLRDITEYRELERELTHRAFHDALTGLPNRVLLMDRVEHALARSARAGTALSVLLIDLDDFKSINDTMGHPVGDELLVAVARRLERSVRGSDTAARLGGDEFAVLVEDVPGTDVVDKLADTLTRILTRPFQLSTGRTTISASIGVATSAEAREPAELMRHADLALYAAKGAGRNQWYRFEPTLHAGMVERHALRTSLDEAIDGNQFRLHYQPIVELAGGRVVGMEALARWPTPDGGMVRPDRFIRLAEETGHIVALGGWVLRRAVADLSTWRRELPSAVGLHVSVNVSARQLDDPGFVDSVRRALDGSGVPPWSLLLELTESVLMGRNERILSDLLELKDLGVRLAIDDFGTGYSSLSYLRDLPIDLIKIDKSFIAGISTSGQDLAMLEGIVRIVDRLGLTTIAEGIETEAQRDLLVGIGCRLGQGYLYSEALPADPALALLRDGAIGAQHP